MQINSYQGFFEEILKEHAQVAKRTDEAEVASFVRFLAGAKRIFVMGAGREGISARGFSMRLAHLGKETHWIWDDTTPGMGKGDVFLVVDGRGGIGMFDYILTQAKNSGAGIAMVTANVEGEYIKKYADETLVIPSAVYGCEVETNVATIQPMGNLFEQHLYIMFDVLALLLKEELAQTYETMEKRHRNVE